MGINGSATCVLNFGENDGCIGELVGDGRATRACRRCSSMMNDARIARRHAGRSRVASARVPERARVRARSASRARTITQLEGPDRAARADHRAPRRAPHAARHEGARRGHPRARRQARRCTSDRADALARQGRRRRPPTTRARSTCSSPLVKAYGSDQALPRLRDRDPDLRRRRLPQGLPGRAVLPRREDLLDLRGHEPHPGDGPRRPQARPGAAARTSQAFLGDVAHVRRGATRTHPALGAAREAARRGAGGARRHGDAAAHAWFQRRQARRWCRSPPTASSR